MLNAPCSTNGSSGWQVVALAGSLGLLIGVSVWLIASSLREPTVATAEPQPPNAGLTLTELAEVEPHPEEPPEEAPTPEAPAPDEAPTYLQSTHKIRQQPFSFSGEK